MENTVRKSTCAFCFIVTVLCVSVVLLAPHWISPVKKSHEESQDPDRHLYLKNRALLRLPPGHLCGPNDTCTDHSACNVTEDGGRSACICEDVFYSSYQQCLPRREPGQTCTLASTENTCVWGALCHDGTCQCTGQEYDVYNSISKSCESRGKHGESCEINRPCEPNAICNSSFHCECDPHFYVGLLGYCQPRVHLGDNCTDSTQCVLHARCEDGRCRCGDLYYNTRLNRCDLKLPLGTTCSSQYMDQCLINGECLHGRCLCKNDSFQFQNLCHKTFAFNDDCDYYNPDPLQCVSNTSCVFRASDDRPRCACDADHFYDGRYCIRRGVVSEPCPHEEITGHPEMELSRQCVDNAFCNASFSICQCAVGYYIRDGHCHRRVGENGTCNLWNEDYYQCQNGLTCVYGLCKVSSVALIE